jgi:hypothetical protein
MIPHQWLIYLLKKEKEKRNWKLKPDKIKQLKPIKILTRPYQ